MPPPPFGALETLLGCTGAAGVPFAHAPGEQPLQPREVGPKSSVGETHRACFSGHVKRGDQSIPGGCGSTAAWRHEWEYEAGKEIPRRPESAGTERFLIQTQALTLISHALGCHDYYTYY